MIEKLRKLNNIPFYTVLDEEFKSFGRVIDMDTSEIVAAGEKIEMPASGSVYKASVPAFEKLKTAKVIKSECFGETDCQVGFCYGYNSMLNALEWHTCNEINIAVTDAVLILAKRSSLKNNFMNSSECKAFLVPKGTAVEVFSDSMHFCPCQVSDKGFGMVVGLTKGTNTPLEESHNGKLLWAKNKWLISHCDNKPLLERSAVAGIDGENYKIKY